MRWVGLGKPRWSGGLLAGDRLIEHAHDVRFFHDDEFLAIDLDLGARRCSLRSVPLLAALWLLGGGPRRVLSWPKSWLGGRSSGG